MANAPSLTVGLLPRASRYYGETREWFLGLATAPTPSWIGLQIQTRGGFIIASGSSFH